MLCAQMNFIQSPRFWSFCKIFDRKIWERDWSRVIANSFNSDAAFKFAIFSHITVKISNINKHCAFSILRRFLILCFSVSVFYYWMLVSTGKRILSQKRDIIYIIIQQNGSSQERVLFTLPLYKVEI